jgi:cysteine sulfinate desulfinase/cysteine desulfurase-like protein
VLRDILTSGQLGQRVQGTGVLAPVVGYSPNLNVDQANLLAEMQRAQMYRSMMLNALQPPQDTLSAANQQALAYSRSLPPAA